MVRSPSPSDMTAACWFNYLLVFLIQVVKCSPTDAGLILLSGQIADAISTPLVGLLGDKTSSRFGRRKTWYPLEKLTFRLFCGAVLVNLSFFFVFSPCYLANTTLFKEHPWLNGVYYGTLAAIFNMGWATVQVGGVHRRPCECTRREAVFKQVA